MQAAIWLNQPGNDDLVASLQFSAANLAIAVNDHAVAIEAQRHVAKIGGNDHVALDLAGHFAHDPLDLDHIAGDQHLGGRRIDVS